MKFFQFTLAFVLVVHLVSCDKLLDFPPGGVTLAEDALQTPEDLQRLLVSTYDVLGNLYNGNVQIVNELKGDNLSAPNSSLDYTAVFDRETTYFTPGTGGIYADFYRAIYRSNVILESFSLVDSLKVEDRQRMEAEARFVRAISHWGAVKLFAQPYGYTADNSHLGIPLRLEASDSPLPRSSVAEVYASILDDLEFAYNNLPATNGVYATKWSAAGYLAHVRFLMLNWEAAANYATEVIESGFFVMDEDLDRYESDAVNPETVFGTVGNVLDNRSGAFRDNYRSDNNPAPQLGLSNEFYEMMLLSGGGDGRSAWISTSGGRVLCNRFNDREYFNIPLVHLTGLKLIRAEAFAELGTNLSIAIDDINEIRDRAFGPGLNDLPATSSAQEVRDAARIEYRKETMCEGTWTDQLVRRGGMGEPIEIRGASWDCPGMALQFPRSESNGSGFIFNEEGGCL